MNITFPQKVNVTDQEIDLSKLSNTQKNFFIEFTKELIRLYSSSNKNRFIVGIGGPPGTGKSVLVAIVEKIIEQLKTDFFLLNVGIDAYHFKNSYLESNYDNKTALKNFKGRYDTYELKKLEEHLLVFKEGGSVNFPYYSREIHEPIENKIKISQQKVLFILEGQWLCHKDHGWNKIFDKIDYCYFIESKNDREKNNVISRHMRGGRSSEDAILQYERNDEINARIIKEDFKNADKILQPYYLIK